MPVTEGASPGAHVLDLSRREPPFRRLLWETPVGAAGSGRRLWRGGEIDPGSRARQRLGLPVVHLDEHYWSPGWRSAEPAAWRARQEGLVAADCWIVDGNHLSTLDVRLGAADSVIFLDLPAWRCAWRATRRVLAGRGRPNTAPGCAERLDRVT